MNKRIIDTIPEIIFHLNQNNISDATAFLGFDACIDNIVRIVRDKKENNLNEYFDSSSQFGEFLKELNNKSCGVELNTKLSKIGGNMVITGNALGNLGVSVDCVGTFGIPEILPMFRNMSENCSLYSIGETISATALEFDQSKVIIFDPGPYNELNWDSIKSILGKDKLLEMLSGKKLISFLNWSEIENSSDIWHGILDEVVPYLKYSDSKQIFFTDFSDCSRRSKADIRYAIDLLGRFQKYFKVVISLNQNEADLIGSALDITHSASDEEFIKTLFLDVNADILTIHRLYDALAYDGSAFERCDTFLCKEPGILTGGGDNYNAGLCYALLCNLDLFKTILFANAVSGCYVKTGISPDIDSIVDFLKMLR